MIYHVYHICYDLLGRIEESAQWFIIARLHSHNLHQGAEFCSQLDDDIGYGAEDEDDDHGDDDHDDDDHDDDDHDDDNHDSTAAEFCSRVPTCAATLL